MTNVSCNIIDDVIRLREAITQKDEDRINGILSRTEDPELVSKNLRYCLSNYRKTFKGLDHSEMSSIWAIPIIIYKDANQVVATESGQIAVVDAAVRMMIRKLFGPEYRITCQGGLIHADALAEMSLLDQAALFGCLAGDEQYAEVQPTIPMQMSLANRIESGKEPELLFILGAASRVNRVISIPTLTIRQKEDFQRELKGRICLHSKKNFIESQNIQIGSISSLAEAYEQGTKILVKSLATKYKTSNPKLVCSGSSNFSIQIGILKDSMDFEARALRLNTTLVSMQEIDNIFKYAKDLGSIESNNHMKIDNKLAGYH